MKKLHKRHRIALAILAAVTLIVLFLWAIEPPTSPYLKDPTLVATTPPDSIDIHLSATPSIFRPLMRRYYEMVPPKRGTWTFPPSAPRLSSIHGLFIQVHEVSGIQYFIDREVAGGNVTFGSSTVTSGEQFVAAFTNAIQTGHVEWWDAKKKGFRKENPIFIPITPRAVLVLPKDRVAQYQKESR